MKENLPQAIRYVLNTFLGANVFAAAEKINQKKETASENKTKKVRNSLNYQPSSEKNPQE